VGHCGLMAACFDLLAPQHVIVIQAGTDPQSERLARAPLRLSLPGAVQQTVPADQIPRVGPLADKAPPSAHSTAFACLGPQCSRPLTDAEELLALLRQQRSARDRDLSTAN